MIAALLLIPALLTPQAPQSPLARVKAVRCTFPVMAISTYGKDTPEAKVTPTTRTVEFQNINADEGTADLKGPYGKYDIIVRYANGYLHLIQSFLDGPLYTTTIFDKKTPEGKYMAVHSRHERTDVALPTYTSSPEQYYGSCELLN